MEPIVHMLSVGGRYYGTTQAQAEVFRGLFPGFYMPEIEGFKVFLIYHDERLRCRLSTGDFLDWDAETKAWNRPL